MKPIQREVLRLVRERSRSELGLYGIFNRGETGIVKSWRGNIDRTKLDTWLNRHVQPLVRARKIQRVDNLYEFIAEDSNEL